MRVLVLDAGMIGVSCAYFLARAGHEVTALGCRSDTALETSFAKAGEVSLGYAVPWAPPGVLSKVVKWLLMEHPPGVAAASWREPVALAA